MNVRYAPINPRFPFILHGGDYNPDQWLHQPEKIDDDFRLFPLAGINSVSVAIFAWAKLEPEEGRFTFDWLDDIMDRCARQGMAVVLATPSGAKPNWMAAQYPEIRRMQSPPGGLEPLREQQQGRHNHCPTSPVYRRLAAGINRKLAERYRNHPALALWHVSNEYGGACHCSLCKAAFRAWLQRRYGSLERLNEAWWTGFWSHTYTAWEQIEAIDGSVNGLALDWRRFVSDQTVDFFRTEAAPLREVTPEIPVTVNMMGFYEGLDYWRFAPHVDVISWDNYPALHDRPDNSSTASFCAMTHDLNRSFKGGKPFMMIESSPSATNWMRINRLLRPGAHRAKSLQAVAHGADSVQYFQLRKGRGGCEKFHGAVIDHVGHDQTRVFADVAQVGRDLRQLLPVVGTAAPAEVGIIADWESRWALAASQGPSPVAKDVLDWTHQHYRPFWRRGVTVDLLNGDSDLSRYKVVIAPSLYMLRDGFGERVEAFVRAGGTFVATFLTGVVNETDLCYLTGWPGPLRRVLGIWSEEIDFLYDDERNTLVCSDSHPSGLRGHYEITHVCERIHAEAAEVAAVYGRDFYAGEPVLTVNRFGTGSAWYLAARAAPAFLDAFYGKLSEAQELRRALATTLPADVTAQVRTDGVREFVFVQNFANAPRIVPVGSAPMQELLGGGTISGDLSLPPYGVAVLERARVEKPG